MFGAISKLFRKSAAAPPPAASPSPTAKRPATLPASKGVSRNETPARSGVSKVVSTPPPASPSSGQGETISIPYASIIRLIPNELWGKLAPAGVAGHQFSIDRATAVAQLATGAVKVKFGDLRKSAPSGVFLNSPAEDNRLIELPLSEILSQLHPDAYSRRHDQVAVHVDQEVPDVFGANGATGAPVRVMQKKEVGNTGTVATRQKSPSPIARAKPPAPEPTPPPAPAEVVPPAATPANVVPLVPAAKPPATTHAPAPATAQAQAPAAPIRLPAAPGAPTGTPTAAPKAPTSPTPPIPKAPTTGARPLPKLSPSPAQAPVPAPAPAPAAASGFTPIAPIVPLAGPLAQGSFTIDLDALAEQWPDAVRQELAQLKIPEAKVALPPVDICEGLKRGRIQYPWRTLRSWIQPTPLYAAPSPHDDLILELPLRTLTPSFLQFIRENPVNRQTAAADNITEFFRRAEQSTGNSVDVLQSLLQEAPAAAAAPAVAPATPPPAAPAAAAPIRAAVPVAPAASSVAATPGDVVLENGLFCVPVSLLASSWPDAVKQDISQFGLANARLDIPVDVLDAGLRSGKIEFAWAELCAWLNPPSKTVQVSINGEQRLTLPIQLIGPLFIKLRPNANRRKAAVMSDIPDLFNAAGVPQAPPPAPVAEATPVAEAAPSPAARPAAPAARTETPAAAAAAAPRPAPTNLSELFGEPTKKSWTPNEIVQRSTRLPGVAGALIALQDGLLVASSLPANLRIEMIAAFVPQIFGRLNQYSKELNLGDATATSFTIPAGTLQIYNAGLIYFAALSKPGENLPIQDLQLIAAELSRHTK